MSKYWWVGVLASGLLAASCSDDQAHVGPGGARITGPAWADEQVVGLDGRRRSQLRYTVEEFAPSDEASWSNLQRLADWEMVTTNQYGEFTVVFAEQLTGRVLYQVDVNRWPDEILSPRIDMHKGVRYPKTALPPTVHPAAQ